MADSFSVDTSAGANEALKELLNSTRRLDLTQLAETFSDDDDAPLLDSDDPEDDRTITRDEFVDTMTTPKLPREDAGRLFDQITTRFADRIDANEVVPFWQTLAEGDGLPRDLARKLPGLKWIHVAKEPIGVKGHNVGRMQVWRSSVPKGAYLPGMALNDGDLGAWRMVHRLKAYIEINIKDLDLTDEELARMVASVDKYPTALTRSEIGRQLPPQRGVNCTNLYYSKVTQASNLFYSKIDIPLNPITDGWDIICMPPPTDASGNIIRQADGSIVMNWSTRVLKHDGSVKDLNDLASWDVPDGRADTWGEWRIRKEGDKIVIHYSAIIDIPAVPGVNAGTGNSVLTPNRLANSIMTTATLELINDISRFGMIYAAVKKGREAADKPTDYQSVLDEVSGFYEKDEDDFDDNIAEVIKRYPTSKAYLQK